MRYLLLILTLATAVAVVDAQGRRGHRRAAGHNISLTEDQRAQVQLLAESLRAAGASRTDIREAIADLFADWGIQRPDRGDGFFAQLSADQKDELRALVDVARPTATLRPSQGEAVSRRGRGLVPTDRIRVIPDRGHKPKSIRSGVRNSATGKAANE